MAEDFEAARSQGDVLVERPPQSIVNIGNSGGNPEKHNVHPSTFKDPSINKRSSYHHHHHHHPPRRHHSSKGRVKKDNRNVADRFGRTATVLRHSGLLKLTLQIAQLIKTNEDLQKEIDDLQREAVEFSENLKSQIQQKLSGQNGPSLS